MYITPQEENRNRIVSGTITAAVFLLLLLFLILFKLITPNPPFALVGGGGGQEMALGMTTLGNDDIDFGKMGTVTDVVVENSPTDPVKNESILTDDQGEEVNITENKKEEVKTTVIKPVKTNVEPVKEKTAAEKLAEKYKKNTGKDGGGIGNNDKEGQNGAPDGNPNTNGTGGTGGGTGGGNGTGEGPGDGPGKGPGFGGGTFGHTLKGRMFIKPPVLPNDTKEEGKVVVEIVVNSEGKVTEANPNGRGTTTNSAILKQKAKAAAMNTTFNVDGKFEEQRGTITIVFAFD